jgi:hypothetical protein
MNEKMECRSISQVSTHDKFLSANSHQNFERDIFSERCYSKREQKHFPIGTIVQVSDRTWPGVNKIGGVARIVKVHDESEAGTKYDVVYVLGGREKLVDSAFVTIHVDETSGSLASTTTKRPTSVESGKSNSPNTRPSRKSRRVDERKKVEEWIAKIDAEEMSKTEEIQSGKLPSSTPKHLLEERENDDGFQVKKKKKHCDNMSSIKNRPCPEDISGGKIEGNDRNKSPVSTSDILVTYVDHILRLMSFQDILEAAMSHYSSVLKMSTSEKKASNTFYITTSSLSDKEQRIVKKMTQRLSTGKGEFRCL